jgi:hypothetical protein
MLPRIPNAPKGAKSAFMYFSTAKRSEIKEANPDASFGDLGKLVRRLGRSSMTQRR